MAKYIFGLEAELTDGNAVNADYIVDYNPTVGNYNPYSKEKINEIICNTTRSERITSIPSPYARMHVTDLAFMELRQGQSLLSQNRDVTDRDISPDYSRALSHCLDVYEMLYYSDEVDLQEKGVTVTKINLKTPSPAFKNRGHLNEYLETLQLYRDQYTRTIRQRMRGHVNENEFTFDFSSLYIFKYKGKTFAASSPFTGFFAKADCNLKDAGLSVKDAEGKNRLLFTNNPEDWRDISGRTKAFREFMYLLLNEKGTKLCYVYNNLFEVVKQSFSESERIDLDDKRFSDVEEYRKFNVGNDTLQKIGTYKNRDLYIRPDNIDCSYLKYLLFLAKPADLSIQKEEYKTAVEERSFDGNLTCWLGPNDILSDALFVLPYDVNSNYMTIPYLDESLDNQQRNRCLIPIKSSGLKMMPSLLRNLNEIKKSISIIRKTEDTYLVKMTVMLENGGQSVIRREYHANQVAYPYGKVISGEGTSPFAFGIFPFVKTNIFDNIYKVLFYHNLDPKTSKKSKLKFFYVHDAGMNEFNADVENAPVKSNQTVVRNDKLKGNCWYYHIEAKRNGLDIVEVVSDEGSSLIIPRLHRIEEEQGEGVITIKQDEVVVSIDLGTSNTYVAYMTKNNNNEYSDVQEISTSHVDDQNQEWAELVFMQEKCTKTDALQKNLNDLYLIDENGKWTDKWLATQLCEFVPSRISPNNRKGYSFPIPSVINQTYTKGSSPTGEEEKIPLFNSAIPFAYYEYGKRQGDYDHITPGKFKWFRVKDDEGEFSTDEVRKQAFRSFVKELLFLLRSNLICQGYNADKVKLIWTFPLSFTKELRDEHLDVWNEEYEKCFKQDPEGRVMFTNESRAPIYACIKNLNNVAQLTLLIDVGGGSTDVFGFKENTPKFASSFSFAGNALYLDGDLNHDEQSQKEINVMRRFVTRDECKKILEAGSTLDGMVKINANDSISSIMNYGFSQAPKEFRKVFQSAKPAFLLHFHNAALIYHIAQLCKMKSPEECPVEIYLTGNGSKLFLLNSEYKNIINKVFSHFYGDIFNDELKVTPTDNPKSATACGSLIGYKNTESTRAPGLKFGDEDNIAQVVTLGDSVTCYDIPKTESNVRVEIDEGKKKLVEENVLKFVDFFFEELYPNAGDIISKDKVKKYVLTAGRDTTKMRFSGKFNESIFFMYIALVMELISASMLDK